MEIKRRQGNRCNQCGVEAPLETDHVVPRSQGGSDDAANLQGLCEDCHSDKTGFERLSFVEEEWGVWENLFRKWGRNDQIVSWTWVNYLR